MKKQVIFLAVFSVIGFGLLYWFLKPASSERTGPQDYDRDGVVNEFDKERNTPWPLDTTVFKLKDYVNEVGKLDPKKIQALCDCWKLPDLALRKQLPCEDNNPYWWISEDTALYEMRVENGNVRFYSGEGKQVKTQDDTKLEEEHKGKFSEFYKSIAETEETTNSSNPEQIITIRYQGVTYKIKQGFTSEEGMESGGALWRYGNNTWKKAPNSNNPHWEEASEKDITYLLTRIVKKVEKEQEKEKEKK
jgi:hypothetical protein